jgi:class 3 adenylate cyclase/tetratricopeptide (TPR) repeat protein
MPCPQCGTVSPAGAKFCPECAAPLAASCPACGSPTPAGAKFCPECAAPLAAGGQPTGTGAPVARPAAAPTSERRLVTVLFADLVGFTPFAEERDAEEVRETLSRYFDMARETIERYGGTVEKFIGDAVMAVWGTPTAREDDAERAVRAGMDLVEQVRILGDAIQARAGVLTGEAAVTLGATDQGMVAGDIVNTAARLQTVAEPGTVLVGEPTMRSASAAIVFERVTDATLKGKASPVPAFRAIRVVAERGGRNRAGGLEAPFVGRDEELRQLKDQYHAVTRESRPRLVSIMGPAGIGKSRLAWEFLKYIDGVLETVWWHSGRSPSYGQGIAFWALGEMIRTRAGLAETADEPTTRAAISAMLEKHVSDEAEREWIEPAMLTLLGIGDQAIGSEQLFAAWRTFFERMAATGAVALVFEDLHWADSGLLDFIDHVLEWTRDLPIYIVTLARPELIDRRPTWGVGTRQFTSIFLEPLPETAMRELLAGLAPGIPDAAMRSIVARADGVPLYAVETVRMLVAEGRLEERDGAYVPVGDLSELAVPDTLTALIASRLDALEPADRSLVQDASVLGQSFTLDALADVTQVDAGELEPRLRALVRRELLVLRADPRAPDRGQYAFVQSLIREVAYHTLAKADRKARHLAAARHFEAMASDEIAGALAGHYLAAHENAPAGAEADALATQARIALRAAAERAEALGAPEQASRLLVQALSVTEGQADEAELFEGAALAEEHAGLHDRALDHFRRAHELFAASNDRSATARVSTGMGRTLLDAYRTEEAVTLLEEALREHETDGAPSPAVIALMGQLARAYFFHDEHGRAVDLADRVMDAAEHANLVGVIVDTMITKGSALVLMGRTQEGLVLQKGGGELAESAGLALIGLRARVNRTFAETLMDPRASLESTRMGLTLAQRLGLRTLAVVLAGNAATVASRTGDWDRALADLTAFGDDLDRPYRILLLSVRSWFAASRGENAEELIAAAEALLQEGADPSTVAHVGEAQAWLTFTHGAFGAARDRWQEMLRLTTAGVAETLMHSLRAALWDRDVAAVRADLEALDASGSFGRAIDATRAGARAGIAALEQRTDEALSLYREVLRTWRDLGLPWDEAMTSLDMVLLLRPGSPAVADAAATARRIFTELGATPFIERLDAALDESTPAAGGSAARAPAARSGGARGAEAATPERA